MLSNLWFYISSANVERWERSVNDDEEELERAKQAEQKQMSEIDKEMRKLDEFKSQRMSKKNDLDNMDEDMALVSAVFSLVSAYILNFSSQWVGSSWHGNCGQRFPKRPESFS